MKNTDSPAPRAPIPAPVSIASPQGLSDNADPYAALDAGNAQDTTDRTQRMIMVGVATLLLVVIFAISIIMAQFDMSPLKGPSGWLMLAGIGILGAFIARNLYKNRAAFAHRSHSGGCVSSGVQPAGDCQHRWAGAVQQQGV